MKLSFFFLFCITLSGYVQAQTTATETNAVSSAPMQTLAPPPLHITKLNIIDTVVGTGDEVTNGVAVEVNYTGWIYNHKALNLHGAKFDSSFDGRKPLSFVVGNRQVIRGWDLGILGMKVGGKRTLMIPAYLAYSTQGSGNIPPNTHLVFDIELLAIKK